MNRLARERGLSRSSTRRGIATVECALCLPLFVAVTFATIDLCSAMFLKESLTLAAYEGARVGVERGGTDKSATARIEEILKDRNVTFTPNSIKIGGPGFDQADTLEHVTITITVPCQGNMPLTGNFFQGRTLTASVTMRKEFENL